MTIWKLWRRGYAAVAVGPLNGGGDWRCYATGTDEEELEVPEVPEVRPPASGTCRACHHQLTVSEAPCLARGCAKCKYCIHGPADASQPPPADALVLRRWYARCSKSSQTTSGGTCRGMPWARRGAAPWA